MDDVDILAIKTCLPMLLPANFLDILIGAQCNFLDRKARNVLPFSQSGTVPFSNSRTKKFAYFSSSCVIKTKEMI